MASSWPLPPWEPGEPTPSSTRRSSWIGEAAELPGRRHRPCPGHASSPAAGVLDTGLPPRCSPLRICLLLRSSAPADHRRKKNPAKRREREQKTRKEKEKTSRWMEMELWKKIAMLMWDPPRETVCVFCGLGGHWSDRP